MAGRLVEAQCRHHMLCFECGYGYRAGAVVTGIPEVLEIFEWVEWDCGAQTFC